MGGWYLTITQLKVDTFFNAYFGSPQTTWDQHGSVKGKGFSTSKLYYLSLKRTATLGVEIDGWSLWFSFWGVKRPMYFQESNWNLWKTKSPLQTKCQKCNKLEDVQQKDTKAWCGFFCVRNILIPQFFKWLVESWDVSRIWLIDVQYLSSLAWFCQRDHWSIIEGYGGPGRIAPQVCQDCLLSEWDEWPAASSFRICDHG